MSAPAYAYDDLEALESDVMHEAYISDIEARDRLEWELQCALHDCMEQFGTSRTLWLVMDIVSWQEVKHGNTE